MSLDQLAMATKIPRSSLALLEEDRFDELPGMVFAKGFLRCCARTLGLEEDTVLGLLYEREREIRTASPKETSTPVVVPPARNVSRETEPRALVSMEGWRDWARALPQRVAAPRVLLWVLVALFVILVVYLAFTIASGQGSPAVRT
jgi:hypothetical protein